MVWKKALYFVLGEIAVFAAGYGLTMLFPESSPYIWFGVAACAVALMVAVWLLDLALGKELKKTQDGMEKKQDRILDYLHREFDAKIEANTEEAREKTHVPLDIASMVG